jgi:hypothetical protein
MVRSSVGFKRGRKLEKFTKSCLIKLNTHARQGVVLEFELSSATKDMERKTSLTPPPRHMGLLAIPIN